MTKEEFLNKVSKIEQTFEDEFKSKYNSPELIWQKVIEPSFSLYVVSNRRELLIDFLDDVLMCQDEGATIVDREKYVDGYLGN